MIKVVKAIFLTLLFILGITFAVENTEPVVLRYYFGLESVPIPVFLLVLFSILVGVLMTGLGFLIDVWLLKKAVRDKERELRSLRKESEAYANGRATTAAESVGHR
ncbi:MAG TPA: LapA family protein [Candidatus Acidoferrales bacterium]|nr:LapA family protein [Candidatus Acidoferrales bacterium]